jgi:hypothetical protein
MGIFGLADFVHLRNLGELPRLNEIWQLAILVPFLCGAVVTLGAGGMALPKRIIGAVVCGGAIGVLYTAASAILSYSDPIRLGEMATDCMWRVFIFAILSSIGVILTELKLPEPRVGGSS